MDIDKAILQAIPVGREHAVGAGTIIEAVSEAGTTTIRRRLAQLVEAGQVQTAIFPGFRRNKVVVYYRARSTPQPRP